MADYNIHFEVLVTQEPLWFPGSQDPDDLPTSQGYTTCTVVQVLNETEDALVCCQSVRFLEGDMRTVSGAMVIPKATITHRAPLAVLDDDEETEEVDLIQEGLEIPEGVPDDLYNLSPEEKRYRGYDDNPH